MSKVSIGILLYFWVVVSLCRKNNDSTEHIITAFQRALRYMKKNAKMMNLDAAFGLVLADGNLRSLLQDGVPRKYRYKIRTLENMANETLYELQRHRKINQINSLFLHTIFNVDAWKKPIKFGDVPLNVTHLENRMSALVDTVDKYSDFVTSGNFTEKDSDRCLIELLKQKRHCCEYHMCGISFFCKKMMIRHLTNVDPAYGVTHNLLFLQVARSQRCYLNRLELKRKIKEYCSYIYWEAKKNYGYGFLGELDDLFLEQVTLCGYEGFAEFLQHDFIQYALSLQAKNGCFKLVQARKDQWRRKREINLFEDDCADHTTGLGVSTMSIILRYRLRRTLYN